MIQAVPFTTKEFEVTTAFGKFSEDDYYKDFNKVEIWQMLELNEASVADAQDGSADQAVTVALRSSEFIQVSQQVLVSVLQLREIR